VKQIAVQPGPAGDYPNTEAIRALIALVDYQSPVLGKIDAGFQVWLDEAVEALPDIEGQPDHAVALQALKTLVETLTKTPVAKEAQAIVALDEIVVPMRERYEKAEDEQGKHSLNVLLNKIIYTFNGLDRSDNPNSIAAGVQATALAGLSEIDFSKQKDTTLANAAKEQVRKTLADVAKGERYLPEASMAALKALAQKLGVPTEAPTEPPKA
jgi:hypothetical protein